MVTGLLYLSGIFGYNLDIDVVIPIHFDILLLLPLVARILKKVVRPHPAPFKNYLFFAGKMLLFYDIKFVE